MCPRRVPLLTCLPWADLRTMEDEIIPADKRHRRLALVAGVLMALVGLLLLAILYGHLHEIRKLATGNRPAAEQKLLGLAKVVGWAGGLSLAGMGVWFWRLGRRINRSARFPPPGMKVIRDTRLRTGASARARANLAQAVALLCVVAGTVGMWYVYRSVVAALSQ